MDALLLIPIALPMLAGALLLASSFLESLGESKPAGGEKSLDGENRRMRSLHILVGIVILVSSAVALGMAWTGEKELALFPLVDAVPIAFRVDSVGALFVTVLSAVWLAATPYAFVYMGREGKEKRYFGFWLLSYGVLVGLDFSGNLITMYFFYELTTLATMPLVLHGGSREGILAGLKYLLYSLGGAYAGLFGIYFLHHYCEALDFVPGGTLNMTALGGHEGIVLAAVFVMLVGFGAKAGMLPLHAWLPTAHPAAPSPASAALSAAIVKAGVLAVIRVVFYVVGSAFIGGTWVQYAWMALALLTVFMGSLLAFREKGFKKRLAYSTVSQVSYIMFGLSLLTMEAVAGALFHVAVHAVAKCGLFLTAGVFLYQYGYTRVEQLAGAGKRMPGLMRSFFVLSLALVGIPPTGGFISKWYLALGALNAPVGFFSQLGPVVLLLSALLTAGYLIPIALRGFFPGKDFTPEGDCGWREPALKMRIPIAVLAGLALLLGIFPNPLVRYVSRIASSLLAGR